MSEFFEAGRWWLLVRKHWFENRKKYTLSIITIGGLMAAWYIFYLLVNANDYFLPEIQAGIYFTGLFICGCLYASVIFSDLASKAKGISFITLPASQFEKFATGFFYIAIALPLVYTSFFYVFNTAALKISNTVRYNDWVLQKKLQPQSTAEYKAAPLVNIWVWQQDKDSDMSDEEYADQNIYLYVWLAFFTVQAFFALGSVYYGRFSFVKTFITILALQLFFYIFFLIISQVFQLDMFSTYVEGKLDDYGLNESRTNYSLPLWVGHVDFFLLKFLFAPAFWAIAYVRLKEKEI
jgi:hypothetical protein